MAAGLARAERDAAWREIAAMSPVRRRWHLWLGLAVAVLLAAACGRIEAPQREGALVVAAFPEPGAIVLPDGTHAHGIAYDYLDGFARQLGVPMRFITVESFEELELLVREGRVHIGAFINSTPAPKGVIFSKTLASMPLWVVQHADNVGPHAISDLPGRTVHVAYGSPAAAALQAMRAEQQPVIMEVRDTNQQDLLRLVANRQVDYAAVDELNMRVAANFQPDLQPVVRLFGKREFAFAFPEDIDPVLYEAMEKYIDEASANGTTQRLYDTYYGHIQRIGPALADAFLADVKTLLPRLRVHFQRAQERTGLDWRLVAALAYRESKWDATATSFTSVRGLMMLTEDTADLLNVSNRLDAGESIRGGADYLLYLMGQLPESVVLPDRLYMALAAYNLGMGHLKGARAIALSEGKNADVWVELKQVLPLLSKPEYYQRLKSGRARGGEAVILVENVRNLFGMLSRIEPPYEGPLANPEISVGRTMVATIQPSTAPPPTETLPASLRQGTRWMLPTVGDLRLPGVRTLPNLGMGANAGEVKPTPTRN
ncbi:MAG: membrane-bound lytic murein transglycosylase MltF [Rhodocyclaceae bacterium]|nr:membrane-bound lytic murein transglycosylase MltF [Rhodocyclaceae bacterium]